MDVEQSLAKRYSNSINSVAYFALLPFGLNDAAVNKEFLGEEQIKGEVYFKIRVSFSQEGGGEDFDDVFVYWFHKQNYRMDYFGYSYQTDGGGVRFRQAVKQREIGGILFADYLNYEASKDDDVSSLARQFEDGKLKLLSEIIQENIEAKKLK